MVLDIFTDVLAGRGIIECFFHFVAIVRRCHDSSWHPGHLCKRVKMLLSFLKSQRNSSSIL